MIEIRAYPLGDGLTLCAEGHAGMGPPGRDVVCAGVSALLYGFAAYLESLSPRGDGAVAHLECFERDGFLRLTTCGLGGADLQGWLVVAEGLRLIEKMYPSCVRLLDGYAPDEQKEGRRWA